MTAALTREASIPRTMTGVTQVELMSARARQPEQLAALFAGGWPAFIDADPTAAGCFPRIRELFGRLEIVLTAGPGHDLLAACWGVPIRWNEDPDDLPTGYSDSLVRALADQADRAVCDTLVICAAQVRPDCTGAGVASSVLRALIDVATGQGLTRAIAPLRLTGKHRYPLTPIEEYVSWTRTDGTALDPWLRTHLSMGARVVTTSDASQVFHGTAAQWEDWSGLVLPATGAYLVPQALAPLQLDHGHDRGTLTEPGVWVRHR